MLMMLNAHYMDLLKCRFYVDFNNASIIFGDKVIILTIPPPFMPVQSV